MELPRVLYPDGRLRVRAGSDDDSYVIALYGELDSSDTARLVREINRAADSSAPCTVIDLSGLDFIDSSGLAVLLHARDQCLQDGRKLQLLRGPDPVHRIFELTATDVLFTFLS